MGRIPDLWRYFSSQKWSIFQCVNAPNVLPKSRRQKQASALEGRISSGLHSDWSSLEGNSESDWSTAFPLGFYFKEGWWFASRLLMRSPRNMVSFCRKENDIKSQIQEKLWGKIRMGHHEFRLIITLLNRKFNSPEDSKRNNTFQHFC